MSYWPHLMAALVGAGITIQVRHERHRADDDRVAGSRRDREFRRGPRGARAARSRQRRARRAGSVATVPTWAWFGGLLGATYVAATTVLGPKLGAASFLALTLAGQMVAALLVDHFGVIGFPQSPLTPTRLLGTALLVVGVLLIMRR